MAIVTRPRAPGTNERTRPGASSAAALRSCTRPQLRNRRRERQRKAHVPALEPHLGHDKPSQMSLKLDKSCGRMARPRLANSTCEKGPRLSSPRPRWIHGQLTTRSVWCSHTPDRTHGLVLLAEMFQCSLQSRALAYRLCVNDNYAAGQQNNRLLRMHTATRRENWELDHSCVHFERLPQDLFLGFF